MNKTQRNTQDDSESDSRRFKWETEVVPIAIVQLAGDCGPERPHKETSSVCNFGNWYIQLKRVSDNVDVMTERRNMVSVRQWLFSCSNLISAIWYRYTVIPYSSNLRGCLAYQLLQHVYHARIYLRRRRSSEYGGTTRRKHRGTFQFWKRPPYDGGTIGLKISFRSAPASKRNNVGIRILRQIPVVPLTL